MNLKQKIVLLIGIIVIVLMGIYPPWYFYDNKTGKNIRVSGYAFFANPPIPHKLSLDSRTEGFYRERVSTNVDYTRLAFQWTMIVIVTSGFILMLKDKKKPQCGDDMPTNPQ